MAYTNHFDRNADASLNNPYMDEKYRGISGESASRVPWNMDRGRSYSDSQTSPAADHRTPSATSPASLRSNNQASRRSVKHITCHYWAHGGCKKTSEECWYAHEITKTVAQKPVQVERGKPAVAGRNASNPHPVYINWQEERSLSTDPNRRPEVQRRLDHIEAKAIPNNPDTELQDYIRNLKTMYPQHSISAPESANNSHINLDVLSTQSRQPAELLPSVGYFASRENGAFHHPFGKDPTNYSTTTHYGGAAPAHQSTQQTSPGHHQVYCPQPIEHLMFENLKYEQMKMMRAKDQEIYRFAAAIDLTIQTMEESQKSNERNIQRLIDVTKGKIEKADLARTQGDDESSYRGGGKLFNSEGSCQLNPHAPALAPKCKVTGTFMLCYDTNHLPRELIAIAEKLSQTHQTAELNISRLKNAKQILGFAFENVGEQAVLPQGWIQHGSPK